MTDLELDPTALSPDDIHNLVELAQAAGELLDAFMEHGVYPCPAVREARRRVEAARENLRRRMEP